MVTREDTVIAANRFGLGARPGELAAIGREPRAWLLAQLDGSVPLPAPLAALPDSAQLLAQFQDLRRDLQAAASGDPASASPDAVRRVRGLLGPAYLQQVQARYEVAVATDTPFRERLVHFWSNHFAVSADKPPVTALAAGLENEAVRPHVTGRFADLLIAVTRHPAMLVYLDNQASIGPNSALAQRAARLGRTRRKLDINENLGREILELHTLGVQGGYHQDDVIALSQALTGWSVGGGQGRLRAGTPGAFEFRDAVHEPGAKRLLEKSYRQDGREQAAAMLRDLALHPATAKHLAEKLLRHFVTDEPAPGAVATLAKAYLDSRGELNALYDALIELPAAWSPGFAKFKTPSDYVVSGLRALDYQPVRPREVLGSLALMGQPPYRPGSPAGWPDSADDWDGADGLMKRIEWAGALGARLGAGVDPLALVDASLGPLLGEHSRTAIRRADSRAQGLTLLLTSPEFMRR